MRASHAARRVEAGGMVPMISVVAMVLLSTMQRSRLEPRPQSAGRHLVEPPAILGPS